MLVIYSELSFLNLSIYNYLYNLIFSVYVTFNNIRLNFILKFLNKL